MAGQTKFADMPLGSRRGWILWAQSHDWGQHQRFRPYYDEMTGELVTFEVEGRGFSVRGTEARHKTPAELKAWAGY